MSKEEFRTWATGKLTDHEIDTLIKLLTKSELLTFKNEWTG